MPPAEAHPPLPPDAATTAVCANCGAVLQGPFCAQCGQHVADFHRSLWRFLGEFFDNALCWDNKALRTLGPLLTQPGVLTREFMAGRRVRYVPPLRLFLFVSAICLTLIFYHQNTTRMHGKKKDTPRAEHSPTPTPDASKDDDDDEKAAADTKAITEKARQAALAGKEVGDVDNQINREMKARIAAAGGAENFGRAISNDVQQHLSWVTFAVLPVFALLLRAAYWRRDSYYFEHLIFSLHYHTFLLLFWTMFIGWETLIQTTFLLRWLSPFNVLSLAVPGVYLYLALREVYGGGARGTVVKVLVIGTIHLLALLLGVTLVGAMAVFMARK